MINSSTTLLGNSRKHPLLWEKCILCYWITTWQCWHLRAFFWKCTFGSEWLVSLKWALESALGFYFRSVVMTDMGYQNYGNSDVCQILQMTILSSTLNKYYVHPIYKRYSSLRPLGFWHAPYSLATWWRAFLVSDSYQETLLSLNPPVSPTFKLCAA